MAHFYAAAPPAKQGEGQSSISVPQVWPFPGLCKFIHESSPLLLNVTAASWVVLLKLTRIKHLKKITHSRREVSCPFTHVSFLMHQICTSKKLTLLYDFWNFSLSTLCNLWAFWGPNPGQRLSSSTEALMMFSIVPNAPTRVAASVLLTDLTVVRASTSLTTVEK